MMTFIDITTATTGNDDLDGAIDKLVRANVRDELGNGAIFVDVTYVDAPGTHVVETDGNADEVKLTLELLDEARRDARVEESCDADDVEACCGDYLYDRMRDDDDYWAAHSSRFDEE